MESTVEKLKEIQEFNNIQQYLFEQEIAKGRLPSSFTRKELMTIEEIAKRYQNDLTKEQYE